MSMKQEAAELYAALGVLGKLRSRYPRTSRDWEIIDQEMRRIYARLIELVGIEESELAQR